MRSQASWNRARPEVFGRVSALERRAADLFYADLVHGPRPRRHASEAWAESSPSYSTGTVTDRAGWTFVAYLQRGEIRLARNVLSPTPAGRIGNVGWVTNNPGSLDLSTPTKLVNGVRVAAAAGERLAASHGAYEKNADDIATYRRFAVFPDRETGERAVFPMLLLLARANNNPRVGEVLRIFLGISDPARREAYENSVRTRVAGSYARRLAVTDAGLSEADRNRRASELAQGLMNRRFLELERFVTDDSQFLERAVLDVESARDMARVGLLFKCSGFTNVAEARGVYAADAAKLREIEALVASAAVRTQLEGILGCGAGIRV